MSQNVQEVTDADFEAKVMENDKPCLVDFWAPWCGPCQMIEPVLEKIASEFAGEAEFFKMNVDENKEIPGGLGVRSIPYLVLFKKGDLVDSIVGAPDPAKLVELVESSLD